MLRRLSKQNEDRSKLSESEVAVETANIKIAQSLYAAFSRGDIAMVLTGCTPDVEWHAGGRREDFPTFGPRKGIPQVKEFFQAVVQFERFTEFLPKEFYADGDRVFALGTLSVTLTSNARQLSSEWIHVITFRGGKVARFREFLDTAAYVAAYRGQGTLS